MPFQLLRDLAKRVAGRNQFVNTLEPVAPPIPNRVTEQIAQSTDALLSALVTRDVWNVAGDAAPLHVSLSPDATTVTFHVDFVVQGERLTWTGDMNPPVQSPARLVIVAGDYPADRIWAWVADQDTVVNPANFSEHIISEDFSARLHTLPSERLPYLRVVARTNGLQEGEDWFEIVGGIKVRAGFSTIGGRELQYAQASATDASLSSLDGRLTSAQAEIDIVEDRLDVVDARLTDAEGDIAALGNEVITDSLVADSIVLNSAIPTPVSPYLSPLQDRPAIVGTFPGVPYHTTYSSTIANIAGARSVVSDGEFLFVAARHTDGNLRVHRASMYSDISALDAFSVWCDVPQSVPADTNACIRMWTAEGSSRILVIGTTFMGTFSGTGAASPVFRALANNETVTTVVVLGNQACLTKRVAGDDVWETVDLDSLAALDDYPALNSPARGDCALATSGVGVMAILELLGLDEWRLLVDVFCPYAPPDPLDPPFDILDVVTTGPQPFAVVGVHMTKRGAAVVYAKTESGRSSLYVQMVPMFFDSGEYADFRTSLVRPPPAKVASIDGVVADLVITQRGAQRNRFSPVEIAYKSSHVVGDRNDDLLFVYWADWLWTISVAGTPHLVSATPLEQVDAMEHTWAGIVYVKASTGSVIFLGDGSAAGTLIQTNAVEYGSQTQRIIKT
jgi:hypothetical protein